MSDELAVLKDVVERLERAELPYMISGSMALNFYAQPRMTRDIDVVVELSLAHVSSVVAAFEAHYYLDEDAVRDAITRQGMFNIIHNELAFKVDLVVRKDEPYRREEFSRRRRVTVDDLSFFIVAPEDLLLSKLAWAKDSHSELQLGDVRNLVRATTAIDWPYVEKWAAALDVTDLLLEVRS